jgi:hypothetical protein
LLAFSRIPNKDGHSVNFVWIIANFKHMNAVGRVYADISHANVKKYSKILFPSGGHPMGSFGAAVYIPGYSLGVTFDRRGNECWYLKSTIETFLVWENDHEDLHAHH